MAAGWGPVASLPSLGLNSERKPCGKRREGSGGGTQKLCADDQVPIGPAEGLTISTETETPL